MSCPHRNVQIDMPIDTPRPTGHDVLSNYVRTTHRLAAFLLFVLVAPFTLAAPKVTVQPSVQYRLSLTAAHTDRFSVEITVDHPPSAQLDFAIPAWTPGYYQILHYENDIEHVWASDSDGHMLACVHPDGRVWQVVIGPDAPGQIVFHYDVHAHDTGQGFFGSTLNVPDHHGYINGASTFLYVVGATQVLTQLSVTLPQDWKVATALAPLATHSSAALKPSDAETLYTATDYDELIDCPLQLGKMDRTDFTADGVSYACVTTGGHDLDRTHLVRNLSKIVHAATSIFGKAPFDHYLFLYHIGGAGFLGGLEHRNSTVIHLDRVNRDGSDDNILAVSAHEFFHAWNVKRLHPVGLGPFDYTRPVRTASLWWAEGVTDYYSLVLLYRTELRDRTWLLHQLAERMDELDNSSAAERVSLEDASRKAWEGESEGFDGLSYYLKGSLVGFYLDLRIRGATLGARSLDDVLRDLDSHYGEQGKPYPETALLQAINAAAGIDLTGEYDRYVRATDPINWDLPFSYVGIDAHREHVSFLGFTVHPEDGNTRDAHGFVSSVEQNTPADRMGLKPGDKLVRINDEVVNGKSVSDMVRSLTAGSSVTLTVLRNGATVTLTGTVASRYNDTQIEHDLSGPGVQLFDQLFLRTGGAALP